MAEVLRPARGGFLRPFGCAQFIIDFLKGEGPKYGTTRIDPARGAPQSDIHAAYKSALHQAMAEDSAAADAEEATRRGRPMTPEEVEERARFYRARIPYKLTRMRYHSVLIYFNMLKLLKWVEPSGVEEPSETQDRVKKPPTQPRVYCRLTGRGRRASEGAIANPLRLLHPQLDAAYFRAKRKGKRYLKPK